MKKYGLQLRASPSKQKKQHSRRPLPPHSAFFRDDDDEDHREAVEGEISRLATKNKSLRDVEVLHKKALEQDPSAFDYDGVYDEMKDKITRPRELEKQERKPKYIQALIEKAKERERHHEIVYERKLAKERSQDDHLYADKEKFVTSAYKKKLAEQAKWLEEERIRQLHEEREDVTKKADLSDFYFNLTKNVAFGANQTDSKKPSKHETQEADENPEKECLPQTKARSSPGREALMNHEEILTPPDNYYASSHPKPTIGETSSKENVAIVQQSSDVGTEQKLSGQSVQADHKRTEDALAAAKERYLARKRAKEVQD